MNPLSLQALANLGFVRYRSVNADFATQFHARTGWVLPASYVEFLCFREPSEMELSFNFVAANGESWEGYTTEFCNVAPDEESLVYLTSQILQSSQYPGRILLPIGVDAGGNYLYLDLSKNPAAVVDVDYGTGMVSTVAQDFDSFVQLLRPADV